MKKVIIALVIMAVFLVGATTVAYGAGLLQTPAQIAADLTGKSVDEVTDARQDGVAYGTQAAQAGKLDEFREQRLAQYKSALDEAVQEGRMTQSQADTLYNSMQARLESCTGDGSGQRINGGSGNGGLGSGNGNGRMNGNCGNCAVGN